MTLNTALRGLPYPQDSDPPDGPSQLEALALGTEKVIGCQATRSAAFSLATGSLQYVPLTAAETFDTHGYHSTASNQEYFTIPAGKGGIYFVHTIAQFAAAAGGTRQITHNTQLGLPFNVEVVLPSAGASDPTTIEKADVLALAAGDTLRPGARQSSGGTINVTYCRTTLLLLGEI